MAHRRKDPAGRKKRAPTKGKPAAKVAAKPAAEPLDFLTTSAVAAELGVNRRTVKEWYDKGCPEGPIAAIVAWRDANIKTTRATFTSRHGGVAPETPLAAEQVKRGQLLELQTRESIKKTQTENQLKLFALEQKRGEMVERAWVQRQVAAIFVRIKERLLNCPDEMETEFPHETRVANKRVLDEYLRRVLIEMSLSVVADGDVDEMILAEAAAILARREADDAVGDDLADEDLDGAAMIAE